MSKEYIDKTAKITNTNYGNEFCCYANVRVNDSEIGNNVSIGDDTAVARCKLGNNVAINRRSYINDSSIDNYSYSGINTIINFTKIGKFCSIARNVDIGGFDHDYHKVTTMPMFRFKQLITGNNPEPDINEQCNIGNDVWIAAGAQILHKANIGDGAVIGAGAIVTKDVPPYAIVTGVPAKIIKFRFSDKIINELLKLKWWNWPVDIIRNNIDWIINSDVNEAVLDKMKMINDKLNKNE